MKNDVQKFMIACGHPINTKNPEMYELYTNLIHEEYNEFFDAQTDVEKFDAALDMIWVILGYCLSKGWDIEGGWKEVARSNLAKIDPETKTVIKREDGKILKPKGWTPPNLTQFVK